jgi:hypothetical protein
MGFSTTLLAGAAVLASVVSTPALAAVTYLDFEGIATYPSGSGVLIGNYYNGGAASNGSVGPNYGVVFTSGGQLLCLNTAAATCSNTSKGGQGIATSQQYALYFPTTNPTMNVAAGFDTGFSFTYSDPFSPGTTVSIFSGLDGTGTLLANLSLPLTASGTCNTAISQGADYCPFAAASLTFSGIARSVVFGGSVNAQVFDDFTFGSATVGGAVPEPAGWAMMILGMGAVGFAMRRRARITTRVAYTA